MPDETIEPVRDNALIDRFELEKFEYLVATREQETAGRQLVFLLNQIDAAFGGYGDKFQASASGSSSSEITVHLATRLAGAITSLFSDPAFHVTEDGFKQLMGLHRWLATIFAISPYRNGDHIIRNRNEVGGLVHPIRLNPQNLAVFCLSFYPDSDTDPDFDALWNFSPDATSMLAMALLSHRALPTDKAHARREFLLEWLPEKLRMVTSLAAIPERILHDVYMHCSYADCPDKHRIKGEIGRILRQALLDSGYADMSALPPQREKPVIAVVLEWFSRHHSIYRTHSTTIQALRGKYHVVGIAQRHASDEVTQKVFEEFHEISELNPVKACYDLLKELRPDMIYFPSVGMFQLTMWLVNMRLAPLQLMALGHPATTRSPMIDGVLVEEDYVGSEQCFSERLLMIPKDGLPYIPPDGVRRAPARNRVKRNAKAPVRIAVCASVMKINPGFLRTLADVSRRSFRAVQFCFYLGLGKGVTAEYVRQTILKILPNAQVNDHMEIDAYQASLNSCDLFANPFPFGNTNGLVDTVRQALPGVCLTGPEVHTHIDEGLFRRLGLPDELIAEDCEAYVRALLRLIEDDAYRNAIHLRLLNEDVEQVLFRGQPEKFVDVVDAAYRQRLRSLRKVA